VNYSVSNLDPRLKGRILDNLFKFHSNNVLNLKKLMPLNFEMRWKNNQKYKRKNYLHIGS